MMLALICLCITFIVLQFCTLIAANACTNAMYSSGRQNVSITVGSVTRSFELYTPWQVNSCPPNSCTGPPTSRLGRGLVMNWHGCNAHFPLLDYHTEISKVSEIASDRGFYTITPLGTKAPSGAYGWNADGISCGAVGVDDFQFFEALLVFIDQELCVDPSMIYTVGFSTGAFLSYGIACRYPDRIAGAGTDAGGLSRSYYETCRSGVGAVPMQAFHSLADPTVPYNGSAIWVGQDEMDTLWRQRNGCNGTQQGTVSYQSRTTTCTYWDCPLAPVESCVLKDIEHCWYGGRSGGFPSCRVRIGDVDATAKMFDFWEANNKRRSKV